MAAFSHQHFSLVLGSVFVPNTSNVMSGLLEEDSITTTTSCFSPICPDDHLHQQTPVHVQFHETSSLDCRTSRNVPFTACTDPSFAVKHNNDPSSMVVELQTANQCTKGMTPMGKRGKNRESKVAREGKRRKQKIRDFLSKNTEQKKLKAHNLQAKKKVLEEVPTGYIHVRARRGQATDSHSLAERVRREKISERMKLLQSLVPGCDKISGKAQILEEIINYVQSLQNQVEFLVAKLASLSPMFNDFEVDLDTNTLAPETLCSLEPSFPLVLQSVSTKLRSFAETIPTSTSFLPQQEQGYNIISQDNGLQLWDMDDQSQKLVNQYGFNNLCPF